ncbi:hypothetical protein [uncultured Kordia sp.]|uniref:hypothetical protein n=1 Tax=uncultured Kordia sp. TaxID=507699 RepID=UPI002639101F|nr:hypothetical protein [uncultured Kordia sp.]
MKKKKLKILSLKKASISKLNGGALAPVPLTRNIRDCALTIDLVNCTTTTWISELYSACCPPSQGIGCESFNFPCEKSFNIPCEL